jgi:hypothetical protein
MAGANESGEDIESGRTNRAEDRTQLWAQVAPGQSNFNGPAILILEVAGDPADPDDYDEGDTFVPSSLIHGLMATGWGGGSANNFGGTPGANGVIGRGGRNQGNGVVGLGGGQPEPGGTGDGGIGVHGLGGPVSGFFTPPGTAPGAGVIGQGGTQSASFNRDRAKHAAGVFGLGGGTGPGTDSLPSHPLSETGGVGVYGKGADLSVTMVPPVDAGGNPISGPSVPSGPTEPGAGVLGRGGIPTSPTTGAKAAGVIGLEGDTAIPPFSETGGSGVYGRGLTGVVGRGTGLGVYGQGSEGIHGHGETGRGGIFGTVDQPQLFLDPLELDSPTLVKGPARAGDFLVTKEIVQRGGETIEVASLWFCTRGGPSTQAGWAKLA